MHPPFNSIQLNFLEFLYTPMSAKSTAKEKLCYSLFWKELYNTEETGYNAYQIMAVIPPSKYAIHWIERRAVSSWIVITSSVMGSKTLQAKPSLPHTCVTTPSYIQVVQCGRERPRLRVQLSTIHLWLWRIQSRRETCWSMTSGREVRTVLTRCTLLTLTPSTTKSSHRRMSSDSIEG